MTDMRFHRRTSKTPQPLLVAESHAGQHGFSVYLDGRRVAWGRSESAAWASYQIARAA